MFFPQANKGDSNHLVAVSSEIKARGDIIKPHWADRYCVGNLKNELSPVSETGDVAALSDMSSPGSTEDNSSDEATLEYQGSPGKYEQACSTVSIDGAPLNC